MEFLIGRSLDVTVTNLLLAPVSRTLIQDKKLNRFEISEQEPDAGLGNGGLAAGESSGVPGAPEVEIEYAAGIEMPGFSQSRTPGGACCGNASGDGHRR